MFPGYDLRMGLDELKELGQRHKTIRDRFERGSVGWARWDCHLEDVRARFIYLKNLKNMRGES